MAASKRAPGIAVATTLSVDPAEVHSFLWEALQDNQATIRSVDGKLNTMLVIQVAPIPLVAGMYKFSHIWAGKIGVWTYLGLGLVFIAFWAFSLFHIFCGILARFDFSTFIIEAKKRPKGVMFPGGAYLQRHTIKLSKFMNDLPNSYDDLNEELAFEILKVSHIRDKKFHHQRKALILMAIWVSLALVALLNYGLLLSGANS